MKKEHDYPPQVSKSTPPPIKLLNYVTRRAQKLTLHTTCGLQLHMLSLFLFTQFVVLGMLFVAGVLLVVVHCTEFSIHMFPLVFLPFLHSFFAFRARFRILGWPLVFLLFSVHSQNKIGNPPSCFCSFLLLFLFTFRIHSLTCAGIRNGKF